MQRQKTQYRGGIPSHGIVVWRCRGSIGEEPRFAVVNLGKDEPHLKGEGEKVASVAASKADGGEAETVTGINDAVSAVAPTGGRGESAKPWPGVCLSTRKWGFLFCVEEEEMNLG
ncbi:hypothetical protein LR48_Vigan03g160000 [Vigna angularis]|uniref:Uncharacterized protein n=2 Tax=Phaseolus angularis TaxID=3914 RepID=A0A0L9U5W2_PHAAN|nr:hypothetical protein LR48_Vigan03g160000 [Vigna angularis]BAT84638.1 hypothetical protein VIGAN_04206500 [Vigna angularis var. angularis]